MSAEIFQLLAFLLAATALPKWIIARVGCIAQTKISQILTCLAVSSPSFRCIAGGTHWNPRWRMAHDRVVITVHGIRTFGQWQERLAALVSAEDPDVCFENYHYGYFSVIAFLIPPLRWMATRRFRKHVAEIAARHPGAELNFVCHSFGTHLVGYGIYGMDPKNRPRIATILLAGSVLRTSFPWGDLISAGRVGRVINDCGTRDNILLLSQVFVLFTGMAGRLGFRGMTGQNFVNRYFDGGHSHYFEDANGATDGFMRKFWVPALAGERVPAHHDDRRTKGPLQGFVLTLLQIADPIKLFAYASLFLTIGFFVYWKPKIEAQLSASQARQATWERDTSIARNYYETRSDIPRAVSTLATSLHLSGEDLANTPAQTRLLRYWLQSLTDLDSSVQDTSGFKSFTWSTTGYILRDGKIFSLSPAKLSGSVWLDQKRILTIGNDGVVRIIDTTNMQLLKSFPIEKPYVPQDGNDSERTFSIETLTAGKKAFDEGKTDYLYDISSAYGEANYKATDQPDALSGFQELNDHQSQRARAQLLDYTIVVRDVYSGLALVHGMTRSSYAGGVEPALIVIDPESGDVASIVLSSIYRERASCSQFIARVSEVSEPVEIRLRRPGETNLLHISAATPVSEESIPIGEAIPECLELRDKVLKASFIFPRVLPEKNLWAAFTATEQGLKNQQYPVDDMLPGQSSDEPPNAEVPDAWKFSGLVNGDTFVGDDYFDALSHAHTRGTLDWGYQILWSEGSSGAQHGVFTACRLEEGIAKACIDRECEGDFCGHEVFESQRLIALTTMRYIEEKSISILNTENFEFLKLPDTPHGGIEDLKFDALGNLSAISTEGELWIYKNLKTSPVASSVSLIPPDYLDEDDEYEFQLAMVREDPIAIVDAQSIARIERYTTKPVWLSGAVQLPGDGKLMIQTSDTEVLVVFNNHSLRLVDAETGAFLSQPLDLRPYLRADEEGEGILIPDMIRIRNDATVEVYLGSQKLVRRPPLTDDELKARLTNIEKYTGIAKTGEPLSGLPLQAPILRPSGSP